MKVRANQYIAICVLSYKGFSQPKVWKKFYDCTDKYNIYIHNKEEKATMSNYHDWEKQFFNKNRIETNWGGMSLVKASLALFRQAFKNQKNKYFILVSGDTIPVFNPDKIHNTVMFNYDNYIEHMPLGKWAKKRRFEGIFNQDLFKDYFFQKHSQWISLNRESVNFFINNDYTEDYYGAHIPDESYFGTMCKTFNIPYRNKNLLKTNWEKSNSRHPITYSTINDELAREWVTNGWKKPFVRKISWEAEITEIILESIEDNKDINGNPVYRV